MCACCAAVAREGGVSIVWVVVKMAAGRRKGNACVARVAGHWRERRLTGMRAALRRRAGARAAPERPQRAGRARLAPDHRSTVHAGLPAHEVLDSGKGDFVGEGSEAQWFHTFSETELAKVHLARAFIANPEVLVLQRPLEHFSATSTSRAHVLDAILQFVKHRGPQWERAPWMTDRPRIRFVAASMPCLCTDRHHPGASSPFRARPTRESWPALGGRSSRDTRMSPARRLHSSVGSLTCGVSA